MLGVQLDSQGSYRGLPSKEVVGTLLSLGKVIWPGSGGERKRLEISLETRPVIEMGGENKTQIKQKAKTGAGQYLT